MGELVLHREEIIGRIDREQENESEREREKKGRVKFAGEE